MMKKIILALAIAISLIQVVNAKWAVMLYMAADNDLSDFAEETLTDLRSVNPSNISILALVDFKGENNTYLYLINTGETLYKGELNMGDPASLLLLLSTATEVSSDSHYALIFYGHGNGWYPYKTETRAFGLDEQSNDYLTLDEIRQALSDAGIGLDLIGFDSCMMATLEVAYTINESNPAVIVASQTYVPKEGWPYSVILSKLEKNPNMSAEDLAKLIVEECSESSVTSQFESFSAFYSNSSIYSILNEVVEHLLLRGYYLSPATMFNYTDLCSIANEVEKFDPDLAKKLFNAVNQTVIINWHGDFIKTCGISVYFPDNPQELSNYSRISFSKENLWDEYLRMVFGEVSWKKVLSDDCMNISLSQIGIKIEFCQAPEKFYLAYSSGNKEGVIEVNGSKAFVYSNSELIQMSPVLRSGNVVMIFVPVDNVTYLGTNSEITEEIKVNIFAETTNQKFDLEIGISPLASIGFDSFDLMAPPPPPGSECYVYLQNVDLSLLRDFRSQNSSEWNWTLVVNCMENVNVSINGTFPPKYVLLVDGDYVKSFEISGNKKLTISIVYDTEPPVVCDIEPVDIRTVLPDSISIKAKIRDNTAVNISSIVVFFDNQTTWVKTNCTTNFCEVTSRINVSEGGSHRLKIMAKDVAGNNVVLEKDIYIREMGRLTIHLHKGWNLISTPFLNYTVESGNLSDLFYYNGDHYELVTEMTPGKGYWIYSPSDCEIVLVGDPLSSVNVSLHKGWNMIGGVAVKVTLNETFFTYDSVNKTYVITNELEPGKGYWIYAFDNITLSIGVGQ